MYANKKDCMITLSCTSFLDIYKAVKEGVVESVQVETLTETQKMSY